MISTKESHIEMIVKDRQYDRGKLENFVLEPFFYLGFVLFQRHSTTRQGLILSLVIIHPDDSIRFLGLRAIILAG
jgi:hypothetical protein